MKFTQSPAAWARSALNLASLVKYAVGAITRTVSQRLGDYISANDYGALNAGTTDTAAVNSAVASANVAYTSTDWWTKHGSVAVLKGNRVAIGAYQSAYAGIIQFSAITWPINATVNFNGGSGEAVSHKNNIADDTTPVNEWRFEAPYHPAIILNQRTAASYTEAQPAHSLGSVTTQKFSSILWQQNTADRFQLTGDHSINVWWLKTFKPSDGSALSKVFQVDAETGDFAIQTSSIDTTDGSALVVGSEMKIRGGSGAINGHETQLEATLHLHNGTSGNKAFIQLDDTTGAIELNRATGATEGNVVVKLASNAGFIYHATYSGLPATAATMKLGKNSGTNVSIIASGAIQIMNVGWYSGAGTPEGAIAAAIGSLYSRTDGGAGTSLYVKQSGSGNTGWVAK